MSQGIYWRDKVQEDVDTMVHRYTNSISEEVIRGRDILDVEAIEIEEPGGSTPSQYALPPGARELIDLIEHRHMNFSIGNIFKAAYRMGNCNHADKLYDLRKIIFFAQRELDKELKVKM